MNKDTKDLYQKDEHRVHYICYHLVWSPKRRKPILIGAVAEDCSNLIKEKCLEKGWVIHGLAIQPDHVHVFVQVFPAVSAETVVKECKGFTSFNLRNKYPETRKLPCLWTKSYFVSTAGMVSSETIKKYIEAQSKN